MKKLSAGIIFLLLIGIIYSPKAQDIKQIIRDGKRDSVTWFLDQGHPVNGLYPDHTLLEMAISENKIDIASLLLKRDADPDALNNGNTPLIYAIFYSQKFNDTTMAGLLVDHGADLNKRGRQEVTPLIYACIINNYPVARILFQHGADCSIRDKNGNDFFFYVLHGSDFDLLNFFLDHGFSIPRTSSFSDGPYMKRIDARDIIAQYMLYDSLHNQAELLTDTFRTNNEYFRFSNPVRDKTVSMVINKTDHEKSGFDGVSRLIVIGDIHGDYESFTDLLKGNRIVNDKLNWNWGNGHLVICGDVFDRGDRVLDCLWLIYKLESQAELSGGKVHYILGNHEMMILSDDDKRYVNDKFIYTCDRLGINYHDLFSNDYVLGKWLRTHNTVVKINNLLIVHGGIPPEYTDMNVTIDQINNRVRYILQSPPDSIDDMIYRFAIRPLWYREYFDKNDISAEMSKTLKYYAVNYIVVGHTPVDNISVLQNGHVIATNVPFELKTVEPEALLVIGKKFYKVDKFGNKYILKIP